MHFKRELIWEVVEGAETFELFKKNFIFDLELNDTIPEKVYKKLLVIQKLFEYSYFEYSFIDIALMESIITLEKCFKLRYEAIEGKKWDKDFYKLIIWFDERKYFNERDREIVDFLRTFRNENIHETNFSFGGLVYIKMLKKIIELIKELFLKSYPPVKPSSLP